MKILKSTSLLIILVFLLTGCISIPIGDGNKIKIGKDGFTVINEENEETTISLGEDEITVTSEDGEEAKLSFSEEDGLDFSFFGDEEMNWVMGENLELPFDLPYGIPIAPDNNIFQYMNSEEVIFVHYLSGNNTKDIVKLYEDFFKKQSFSDKLEVYELGDAETIMNTYRVETDEEVLEINVMGASDDIGVTVTIAYRTDFY